MNQACSSASVEGYVKAAQARIVEAYSGPVKMEECHVVTLSSGRKHCVSDLSLVSTYYIYASPKGAGLRGLQGCPVTLASGLQVGNAHKAPLKREVAKCI